MLRLHSADVCEVDNGQAKYSDVRSRTKWDLGPIVRGGAAAYF